MSLLVGGEIISVNQLGPDFVLVGIPQEAPPGEASLVLQVDQSERSWRVHLPDGMSAGSRRVALAAAKSRLEEQGY
jgi:hypothetical protein